MSSVASGGRKEVLKENHVPEKEVDEPHRPEESDIDDDPPPKDREPEREIRIRENLEKVFFPEDGKSLQSVYETAMGHGKVEGVKTFCRMVSKHLERLDEEVSVLLYEQDGKLKVGAYNDGKTCIAADRESWELYRNILSGSDEGSGEPILSPGMEYHPEELPGIFKSDRYQIDLGDHIYGKLKDGVVAVGTSEHHDKIEDWELYEN
ncbi:MAG: hypothetical protein ABEJ03_05350 [Candidatus Nanohaloarchaea archaeon]